MDKFLEQLFAIQNDAKLTLEQKVANIVKLKEQNPPTAQPLPKKKYVTGKFK